MSRAHASPPVRALARSLGIDLAAIGGSGRLGRVLREDVCAYVRRRLGDAGEPPQQSQQSAVHRARRTRRLAGPLVLGTEASDSRWRAALLAFTVARAWEGGANRQSSSPPADAGPAAVALALPRAEPSGLRFVAPHRRTADARGWLEAGLAEGAPAEAGLGAPRIAVCQDEELLDLALAAGAGQALVWTVESPEQACLRLAGAEGGEATADELLAAVASMLEHPARLLL
jgi:hypothetical protein